jgi:hypothetical protein
MRPTHFVNNKLIAPKIIGKKRSASTAAILQLNLVLHDAIVYRVISRGTRVIRLRRTRPKLAADAIFAGAEWKGAYLLAKKKPPAGPPTIREVIHQIAILGFLGRKSEEAKSQNALARLRSRQRFCGKRRAYAATSGFSPELGAVA